MAVLIPHPICTPSLPLSLWPKRTHDAGGLSLPLRSFFCLSFTNPCGLPGPNVALGALCCLSWFIRDRPCLCTDHTQSPLLPPGKSAEQGLRVFPGSPMLFSNTSLPHRHPEMCILGAPSLPSVGCSRAGSASMECWALIVDGGETEGPRSGEPSFLCQFTCPLFSPFHL